MVDLPEPEKPVKNTTRPRCRRGGRTRDQLLGDRRRGVPLGQREAAVEQVVDLGRGHRQAAVARRDVRRASATGRPGCRRPARAAPARAGRRRRACRRWTARGSRRTRRPPARAAARRASRRRAAAAAPPRSVAGWHPVRAAKIAGPATPAAGRPGPGPLTGMRDQQVRGRGCGGRRARSLQELGAVHAGGGDLPEHPGPAAR
jgi:hypothetical protein